MPGFSQIWPMAVGWDPQSTIYVDPEKWDLPDGKWAGVKSVELVRDPDSHGPCLVCGEPTDWHLLHANQRVCSTECVEGVRAGQAERTERRKVLVYQGEELEFKPIPDDPPQRRHSRPTKPTQRPCGGCPGAKARSK